MVEAILSTLLRSSRIAVTVAGSLDVSRATAVTLCPRFTSSCKILRPELPVAPYRTTFISIAPSLFIRGNTTLLSALTHLWIQKDFWGELWDFWEQTKSNSGLTRG